MTTRQPWLKWYPADFRADPRVRMCSLATRGLWIELLGYMHEADPYGFLVIAGVAPSVSDVASLVGAPVKEVARALDELEAKGVCGVDDEGRIYSRRMVRDKEKAEADRHNGSKGGNPRLRGGGYPVDGTGGLTPGDKAQKPEARYQIPEDQKPEGTTVPTSLPVVAAQARPRQGDLITREPSKVRGTRLAKPWPLTEELRSIGMDARDRASLPPIDIDTEHARFCDYWHARAGREALKVDWIATWRNWCRNSKSGLRNDGRTFGERMRNSIAEAASMLEPESTEAPTWPALPGT